MVGTYLLLEVLLWTFAFYIEWKKRIARYLYLDLIIRNGSYERPSIIELNTSSPLLCLFAFWFLTTLMLLIRLLYMKRS